MSTYMGFTEYHRRVLRASEEWTNQRVWVPFFQCYASVHAVTPQGLVKLVFSGSGSALEVYVDLSLLGTQVVLA